MPDRPDTLPVERYERAERLLRHNRSRLALRSRVEPKWVDATDLFWYVVDTTRGREYMMVDCASSERRAAFDQERLARSLGASAQVSVDPFDLQIEAVEFDREHVTFVLNDDRWSVDLSDYRCMKDADYCHPSLLEVRSPDGDWLAFRRGDDVWIRRADGSSEFALTNDGTRDLTYGQPPDSSSQRRLVNMVGLAEPRPLLSWSPNSRYLLTHRTDQRGVRELALVESAPEDGGRPRLHVYRYPMPGETLPRGEWVLFDVEDRAKLEVDTEPFLLPFLSPLKASRAWWAEDSSRVLYLDQPRDLCSLSLKAIDPTTGKVEVLIEESGTTRLEPSQDVRQDPMVKVLSGNRQVLWYSQRDGWGHIYFYDLDSGQVIQLTQGEFAVQQILHVDERQRVAFLAVCGLAASDPYVRSLVSVRLDGTELQVLTNDEFDHAVTAHPDGRWFVDSSSTVEEPPVTVVRNPSGEVVFEVDRADIGPLLGAGWTPPQRFRTVAADGRTPLYGILYTPQGFDPDQSYPVLDHTYPGPQIRRADPWFDAGYFGPDADAMAAIGFVVVALDGRGTPGRDKAFHDHAYGNLGSAGAQEDHVEALSQLAETRPWMDLNRVGIFGHSGGGFATVRALLKFPKTFKVGVAESGNQDNRFYHAFWAEMYDGPFDPASSARLSNVGLADALEGKLLLMHGEMDDNVTPHLTMKLVDALISADKDFDLLILPGAEHGLAGYEQYTTRRRWDYFVRHLMGCEPPVYHLAPIPMADELRAQIQGGSS